MPLVMIRVILHFFLFLLILQIVTEVAFIIQEAAGKAQANLVVNCATSGCDSYGRHAHNRTKVSTFCGSSGNWRCCGCRSACGKESIRKLVSKYKQKRNAGNDHHAVRGASADRKAASA